MELHGFSDASQTAYAAVVYAKIVTESAEIYVKLLQSKTKVAAFEKLNNSSSRAKRSYSASKFDV